MGDTYRPSRQPPRNDRHNLPLMSRMTFSSGGGDSYRPGPDVQRHGGVQGRNNHEFTFTSGGQGPRFPPPRSYDSDASIPRGPRNTRGGRNGRGDPIPTGPAHGSRRERDNNFTATNARRGGRAYRAPPVPHQRAILHLGESGLEHTLGVAEGSNKFRDLDELSESEPDMQLDTDDTAVNGQADSKKSRLDSSSRADGDSIPRWSNPDFYTAAPPPGEATGKRIDFVSLIRKAKKDEAEQSGSVNALAANDDFISFDDDKGLSEVSAPPAHHGSRHPLPPRPAVRTNQGLPPPPAPPTTVYDLPPLPPPPPIVGSLNDAVAAGAVPRNAPKRTADAAGLTRPQPVKKGAKRKRGEQEGAILEEWLPTGQDSPAPWCQDDHSDHRGHMTRWLHNEIMDFYDYVRPDEHENQVRSNLMDRIQQTLLLLNRIPFKGKVLCFGSYPAGLYLPTADMDLVYASDQFINGGRPLLDTGSGSSFVKNMLWAAARRLEQAGIATDLTVIAKAKVPIIKFVDRISGIKVDLSFENLSGVEAQTTFRKWKSEYTDVPYLVALVKQFLLMRGLNEVHLGGIGGFSTICLAVSHIQMHGPGQDLGDLFLRFLENYGNFDLRKERIVMKEPFRVNKVQYGIDGRLEKPDGLSIQDPNNANNNISGGSNKARQIFDMFRSAHRTLQGRMTALSQSGKPARPESILECILGGDYSSYEWHRAHISTVDPTTRLSRSLKYKLQDDDWSWLELPRRSSRRR